MKRRRHTPEQVVRKLREADRMLAEGKSIAEVAKALEVSENTFHRWRAQIRLDEGGRRQALEGARARELDAEANRREQGARNRRPEGDIEGKLVSPSRRRGAVLMLRDRLGVSERRACEIAGQHRSTQRREACVAEDDAVLRATLRKVSEERPRWGYRSTAANTVALLRSRNFIALERASGSSAMECFCRGRPSTEVSSTST
jgi:putative transposase